jgi:hypothetical protein
MNDGAGISTAAVASTENARNITLSVGNLLYLVNSKITTSVTDMTGNGGHIKVDSGLAVLDQSKIIAQAEADNGGNIRIDAGEYEASADSIVSASSQKGISGMVEINGLTPLNGALVALSSELRNPAALTQASCAARANQPQSSLAVSGAAACRKTRTRPCRRSISPARYPARSSTRRAGSMPAAKPPINDPSDDALRLQENSADFPRICNNGPMPDRFRRPGGLLRDWCSFQMGTVSIWLHPPQETPVDRAIRKEGERPGCAFPKIDFDHPGPGGSCGR